MNKKVQLNYDCIKKIGNFICDFQTLCNFYLANKKTYSFRDTYLFDTIKEKILFINRIHTIIPLLPGNNSVLVLTKKNIYSGEGYNETLKTKYFENKKYLDIVASYHNDKYHKKFEYILINNNKTKRKFLLFYNNSIKINIYLN